MKSKVPRVAEECAPGETVPLRARILTAAFALLREQGYAATNTREIAARARVSKREIYSEFGSKEGILAAMIASRASRMRQPLRFAEVHDRASFVATLRSVGVAFLEQLCDPAVVSMFRLVISEAERSPAMSRVFGENARTPNLQALEALMRRARSTGVVAGNPSAIAAQFFALLAFDVQVPLLLGLIAAPDRSEIVRRAKSATDAILRLYGTRR